MTDFAEYQILEDEIIENKYKYSGWNWLLTNKRIIRYKTGMENIFEDLDYKYIVSVRLIEIRYIWLLVFGIPTLLIGLWLSSISYNNTEDIIVVIYSILILTGIILTFLALLKNRKCEIIAHGTKWVTKGNPRELTRDIRRHM